MRTARPRWVIGGGEVSTTSHWLRLPWRPLLRAKAAILLSALATISVRAAVSLHSAAFSPSETLRTDPHGLNGTDDAEFDLSFRWVYNHSALEVPWYAVLGNHDYGDGATDADNEACMAADGGCTRSPLHQVMFPCVCTVCVSVVHMDPCSWMPLSLPAIIGGTVPAFTP